VTDFSLSPAFSTSSRSQDNKKAAKAAFSLLGTA